MSIEKLFDHTCDIYHVVKEEKDVGYGLPSSSLFKYNDTPDLVDVPCHFHVKDSVTTTLSQNEPQATYESRVKVGFHIDADIRLNDKIVHKQTGLEYYAEIPKRIRGHHASVTVQRYGKRAAL